MLRARAQCPAVRKAPQRARSHFTVDALLDATIQVLCAEGPQRLTTTRVARRAGVSVGAVYQYFDNRLALLYAAHRRHVRRVAAAMIRACRGHHGRRLSDMASGLVRAYVQVKVGAAVEARALYHVRPELEVADLVAPESLRVRGAVERMLATAADARFADLPATAWMFMTAMTGPIRAALEDGAAPVALRTIGEQTIMLCESYLRARAVRQ
jgi:AcrR family transcriptional regulator